MTTYAEKLKDPRWNKRRLEILNISNYECCGYGISNAELHVHHRAYRDGAAPWEYEDHELVCVCRKCHEWIHEVNFTTRQKKVKDVCESVGFALAGGCMS